MRHIFLPSSIPCGLLIDFTLQFTSAALLVARCYYLQNGAAAAAAVPMQHAEVALLVAVIDHAIVGSALTLAPLRRHLRFRRF